MGHCISLWLGVGGFACGRFGGFAFKEKVKAFLSLSHWMIEGACNE